MADPTPKVLTIGEAITAAAKGGATAKDVYDYVESTYGLTPERFDAIPDTMTIPELDRLYGPQGPPMPTEPPATTTDTGPFGRPVGVPETPEPASEEDLAKANLPSILARFLPPEFVRTEADMIREKEEHLREADKPTPRGIFETVGVGLSPILLKPPVPRPNEDLAKPGVPLPTFLSRILPPEFVRADADMQDFVGPPLMETPEEAIGREVAEGGSQVGQQAVRIAGRAAGAIPGAVKGIRDVVETAVTAAGLGRTPEGRKVYLPSQVQPLPPFVAKFIPPETVATDVRTQAGKAVLDTPVQKAVSETEALLQSRLGLGVMQNIRTDLADQVEGIAALGSFALGGAPSTEERIAGKKGVVPLIKAAYDAGSDFAQQMVGGAVGGTYALLANPGKSIESLPVTTVLSLLEPASKITKAGFASLPPRSQQALTRGATTARNVLVALIPEAARLTAAELAVLANRFLIDPNATLSTPTRELLDRITIEARQAESQLKSMGERAARQVDAGGITDPTSIATKIEDSTPIDQLGVSGRTERRDAPLVSTEGGAIRPVTEDAAPTLQELMAQMEGGTVSPPPPAPQVSYVESLVQVDSKLDGVLNDIAKAVGEPNTTAVRNHLDNVLASEMPYLLQTPEMQKLVIAHLDEVAKKQGLSRAERRAQALSMQEAFKNLDPDSGMVVGIGDATVNVMDEVARVVMSDEKTRNRVLASTIQTHVEDMASTRRKAVMAEALADPLAEAAAQAVTSAPTQLANNLLSTGSTPPAMMGVDPALVRESLARMPDSPTKTRLNRNLSKYEKIDHKVAEYLDVPQANRGDLWVHKDLNTIIGTQIKMHDALTSQGGVGVFNRIVKANLTARNPISLVNNVNANVILQTIRTGNPLVFIDIFRARNKYRQFMLGGGEGLSAADTRMYKALESGGIADANLVSQELGISPELTSILANKTQEVAARALEAIGSGQVDKALDILGRPAGLKIGSDTIGKVNKVLENVYGNSDTWFRVHEGARVFQSLDADVQSLKPGQWIEVEVGPGRTVRIEPGGKLTDTLTGKDIPSGELDKILGRSATHHANKLYFDYGSKPGLVSLINSAPLVGILSPFVTWSTKALRLPMEAYRSTPVLRTNSASILGRMAAESSAASLRRVAMIQAARTEIGASKADARKVLQYASEEAGSLLVDMVTNPAYKDVDATDPYARVKDVSNWSFAGPLDLVLRAGITAQDAMLDDLGSLSVEDLRDIPRDKAAFLTLRKEVQEGKVSVFDLTQRDFDAILTPNERSEDPSTRRQLAIDKIQNNTLPDIFLVDPNDPTDMQAITPEARQRLVNRRKQAIRYESGEAFGGAAATQWLGAAGGPILDAWELIQKGVAEGVDAGETYRRLLPALAAGWIAKSSDTVIGIVDPLSTASNRASSLGVESAGVPPEDLLDWTIRKWTGMAYRPVDVFGTYKPNKSGGKQVGGKINKHYDMLAEKWTNTLQGALKDRYKAAVDAGMVEAIDTLQPKLDVIKQEVDAVIKRMREEAFEDWGMLSGDSGEAP